MNAGTRLWMRCMVLMLAVIAFGCSDSTVSEGDSGGEESGSEGSQEGGVEGTAETGDESGTEVGEETGSDECFLDEHCTDLDACTADVCLEGVCVFEVAPGTACDDGDACTGTDLCDASGTCIGGASIPGCGEDACLGLKEGDPCDDADCCTNATVCAPCVGDSCPESALTCGGGSSPCLTDNACVQVACECDEQDLAECLEIPAEDGVACDFNENDCTVGDVCLAGQCIVGDPMSLDDNNPCTQDLCVKGVVTHEPELSGQCTDENECTVDDFCYLGACVGGEQVVCEDVECASSVLCLSGLGCHVADWLSGVGCDDGSPCTVEDLCQGEEGCVGGVNTCDDGNVCTFDSCGEDVGECEHLPIAGACDDGNSCTVADACAAGVCQGSSLDCSYLDAACATGSCLDGTCLALTIQGACDDDDACTEFSVCDLGECIGGTAVVCDDDDACTDDSCSAVEGCVHVPSVICDDGNACNGLEFCQNSLGCTAGEPLACDDGNPCTLDECDSGSGCTFSPWTGECDDGDACTSFDSCKDGQCSGKPLECPDPGPCFDSWCENDECMEAPNSGGTCDDGDDATCSDVCEAGVCGGGPCEEFDATTCASALDLGLGGYYEFDLCEKKIVDGPGSCSPAGLDHFVKVQAQYATGSFDILLIQGFPGLLINYRFYKLNQCEQPDNEWFCYENQTANIGWSGYDPADDVYVGFGSSDGSCGIVAVDIVVGSN